MDISYSGQYLCTKTTHLNNQFKAMSRLITLFVTILLFATTNITVYSADHDTTKIKELRKNGMDYPRKPGINGNAPGGILLHYSASHICFDLPAEVDFLEIQIEDANGMMWTGMVCQEDPCVDTPVMTFPSHIYCTTETGITLSATLD